jgi:hypothetical protein
MQQNFIELVSVPFQAGESKLFHVSGRYFELIDAPNPVDVLLSDRNGAQRGIMRAAEASFYLKDTDFATVQLTSATTQLVRFGYGTGEAGTRRAAGSVSIANQPTVVLQAADMALIRRPELPAANWRDTSTLVANTPLTVFNAAANPNGALIWSMEANDNNGAAASLQVFIAKATAPVSVSDGEVIAQSKPCNLGASYDWAICREQPTRIAGGLGLYFIGAAAGTAGRLRNCRYTLL